MSELKVDPRSLVIAADHARSSHDSASLIANVGSVMERIASAITGTACGPPAVEAGCFIDALAERNSDGLRAYEATLRDVAEVSTQVPVIVVLHSPRSQASADLATVLEQLADQYSGRFQLARVNVDTAPEVAQARRRLATMLY